MLPTRTYIIIEYYILHLSFRAAVSPLYPFVPLPIQRIQAGLPGKQATKRGRKFLGTTFSFAFFLVTETKGYDKNYLPYLTYLPRYKPATANRRTVNCDFETKPLCVITQKWSMHAIICDIQFAHGVNLPIFLVTLFPFPFLFLSFPFLFLSFSFFLHIYLNVHGTADAFDMCVFRRQVPGDTQGTYLTLTFFFLSFFRHLFGGLLLVTLQLAMLVRNKQWMLIYSSTSYSAVSGKCGSSRISSR